MGDTRNTQINFRVTEQEKLELKKRADDARLSMSDYLLALARNKKIYSVDGIEDFMQYFAMAVYELDRVKSQIIKCGTNINQIAHTANATHSLNDNEVKYVNMNAKEVKDLALKVASIGNALVEIVNDRSEMFDKTEGKFPKV